MTIFRPCIDLHNGRVKQIVGGSLRDDGAGPRENFVSEQSAGWFAHKYRSDGLSGGHVIKLGPGNEEAAKEALAAYPGGLQIGGGITASNAIDWIDAGASHVIVTSWLFDSQGHLLAERLTELASAVGRERIVLDLSCRRCDTEDGEISWRVAMNRWQTLTNVEITPRILDRLAMYASEFLIHAADVEGLCQGIDADLVRVMGNWGRLPMTYAGGAATLADVQLVESASAGKVDVTVGSALDLFGGTGVRYDDLIRWNCGSR
jgi:phosphoribosylformimino-5-aminoimidazole carboxamide ribotide isomerase